jgi:lysophospholipase L1-like esterase
MNRRGIHGIGIVPPVMMGWQDNSLLQGLIGYWKMDEVSTGVGSITRLDSLNKNALTDSGNMSSIIGRIGQSCNYSAGSCVLIHADNADLSTGDIDFTVAAWVNLADKAALRDIITRLDDATHREYRLFYKQTIDRFDFYIANAAGAVSGEVQADILGSPVAGVWYFVIAWHDSINNKVYIQINNFASNNVNTSDVPGDIIASFRVGGTGLSNTMLGFIDEVGFWKRVLTVAERTRLWNGGLGNSYPFTSASGGTNVLMIGDSKTAATTDMPSMVGYLPLMASSLGNWHENPPRYAVSGMHITDMAIAIPGVLTTLNATPDYILMNMGVTDLHTGPYIPLPATFQTDYGIILDALHAKWPFTRIYLMRVWKRWISVEANWGPEIAQIDDTIIPALIATRSTWCFFGPDERIFLEGGDDGVTLTTDGVHPNHAGYIVTAAAWKTALGY